MKCGSFETTRCQFMLKGGDASYTTGEKVRALSMTQQITTNEVSYYVGSGLPYHDLAYGSTKYDHLP